MPFIDNVKYLNYALEFSLLKRDKSCSLVKRFRPHFGYPFLFPMFYERIILHGILQEKNK